MGVVSCGTTMLDQGVFQNIGAVTWDTTAKTAGFTAVSGNGYFVNTTSGGITVTLPATPSAGDIVGIKDYANTADTNNITIGRNGSNIQGSASDYVLNVEGRSVLLVYVDATKGWLVTSASQASDIAEPITFLTATGGTITTCGNCKIHTFTSPGTFCVSAVSTNCASENIVSYMVVAGGGGSGDGGGGGGGYREVKNPITAYTASPKDGYPTAPNRITVTASPYPITVGGGGSATPINCTSNRAGSGSNSIFSSITSAGGGYGGNGQPGSGDPGVPTFMATASPGGSGGGSGSPTTPNNTVPGGTGNTPPVSPPQGNNGGAGRWQPGSFGAAGGGGGAGGVGACYCGGEGVTGGPGTCSAITGTTVQRAAGGPSPTTANTGNGGRNNQAGQSGIVVIRYKYQ